MYNSKPWIAFKEPSDNYKTKFYLWDEKQQWYLSPENPNMGHDLKTVTKYNHAYLFGDSKEDIEQQIKINDYVAKYGDGQSGDIQCPNCGRWHHMEGYMDYNDGYYSEGINQNFQEKVNCLCGKMFMVTIAEVKIIWQAKKI
jgi:hypothetical protein